MQANTMSTPSLAKPKPLSKEEHKRLYNRFSVLKNKAKTTQVPFNWAHFDEFYNDLMEIAPPDYTVDGYRMRFDESQIHPEGEGYGKNTMSVYKTQKQRHKDTTNDPLYRVVKKTNPKLGQSKSRDGLMSTEEAAKLSKVSAHLVLILQELDGDAQLLIDLAAEAAGHYQSFANDTTTKR